MSKESFIAAIAVITGDKKSPGKNATVRFAAMKNQSGNITYPKRITPMLLAGGECVLTALIHLRI